MWVDFSGGEKRITYVERENLLINDDPYFFYKRAIQKNYGEVYTDKSVQTGI